MKKLSITLVLLVCAISTLQAVQQRYNPRTGNIEYYMESSGLMGFTVPHEAD